MSNQAPAEVELDKALNRWRAMGYHDLSQIMEAIRRNREDGTPIPNLAPIPEAAEVTDAPWCGVQFEIYGKEYLCAMQKGHDGSHVAFTNEMATVSTGLPAPVSVGSDVWVWIPVTQIPHPTHGGQVLVTFHFGPIPEGGANYEKRFVTQARFDCGKWDFNSDRANANGLVVDAWQDLPKAWSPDPIAPLPEGEKGEQEYISRQREFSNSLLSHPSLQDGGDALTEKEFLDAATVEDFDLFGDTANDPTPDEDFRKVRAIMQRVWDEATRRALSTRQPEQPEGPITEAMVDAAMETIWYSNGIVMRPSMRQCLERAWQARSSQTEK
jgi:hypothetical protein